MKNLLLIALMSLTGLSALADTAACNIKVQQVAQAIARFNGLSGNLVESNYSTTDRFIVTVDKQQVYTIKVGQFCQIQQVNMYLRSSK